MQNDSEFLGAIFFNFVNRLYEHTDDFPKLKTWATELFFTYHSQVKLEMFLTNDSFATVTH